MPEDAGHHVVRLDNHPGFPVPNGVVVRPSHLELSRLGRRAFTRQDGLDVIVTDAHFLECPERYAANAVTILAENLTPRSLLSMLEHLREREATCAFTPETVGDGTMAMMAASLGVPVSLLVTEGWSEEVLRRLLDYFLHSPALDVEIEPFFAMSQCIGASEHRTLWDLSDEVLGTNWFIDEDGRVSLSKRWANAGEYFGHMDDPVETLRESDLWRRLGVLKRETFTEQKECAFCKHYPFCAGYWTTSAQSEEECAMWQRLMDEVQQAFRVEVAASLG